VKSIFEVSVLRNLVQPAVTVRKKADEKIRSLQNLPVCMCVVLIRRENSVGRLSEPMEQSHEYFTELQSEANELDKQIEITQPLINLLDNMVTMGSLYGSDNLLYAAEYKKVLGIFSFTVSWHSCD